MNAYELADRLENEINLSENLFVFDAADTLRQQADRIAELEKEIEECWCGGHSYAYLRAKNRLPQTKPLSDEEIWQVGRTLGYEFTNKNPDNVFLQFARVIEERHGIK